MTNNDIHVGDIVITDALTGHAHLNGRPLEVLNESTAYLLCRVLIERPDDPRNALSDGKQTRVRARKTLFRKL